ncbi:MAG TPA: DUF6515 family protein [Syntrophales bacterium]|nr:DUF6515 family protein [Syntrophales bacterium]
MASIQNTIKCVAFAVILAALSGIMLLGFSNQASAQRHVFVPSGSYSGYHGGYGGYHGGWYGGYHGGWHGGYRGWYYGGWWYPWAAVVPFLPFYYQTIWIGSYPYYYADGIYYAPAPGGYMVVSPPQGTVSQESPSAPSTPSVDKLFIYPRKGQSEKQQAEDQYQCHLWAVGQTGYDPTRASGGAPLVQKRADYQRAMGACLDARGYTAK